MLENADWQQSSAAGLNYAMEKLDDRSRDILQQRWLSEDKATLHDLASKYGVSAERIRQCSPLLNSQRPSLLFPP